LRRIAVLVKYVPDAGGDRQFTALNTTDRDLGEGLLSELDEYAVEQALLVVEALGEGHITYVTMGPESAATALKRALSMGGDDAIHVSDPACAGSDAVATAVVLAKALASLNPDLILTGMASTDAGMSVVPVMIAELLGIPAATFASSLAVDGDTVTTRRDDDSSSTTMTSRLPTLVSVTDQTGEARYPSFKGIVAAKKKPVRVLSLSDLQIEAGNVGLAGRRATITTVTKRPTRQAGITVVDDGEGAIKLAEFLVANKFI